jgi:hypothetical protein
VLSGLAKLTTTSSQFNVTGIKILNRHVTIPSILHERDIIESAQNGIESAANGIATAVPAAISKVQSAASTTVTEALNAVKAAIPRNCSIGTTQFCIGLAHNISCHDLPVNLSNIIPADVEGLFQVKPNDIKAVNGALAKVTVINIRDCFIAGLILILAMAAISVCLALGPSFSLAAVLPRFKTLRIWIHLLLGLLCCIPFTLAAIILHVLNMKAQQLPSWIQVEQGEVGKLCLGSLCCAIIIVLLGSTITAIS